MTCGPKKGQACCPFFGKQPEVIPLATKIVTNLKRQERAFAGASGLWKILLVAGGIG